jgi:hypothetical protein
MWWDKGRSYSLQRRSAYKSKLTVCRYVVDWSIRADCAGRLTRHSSIALRGLAAG